MAADFGAILLKNQLKELSKNPIDGFSVGLADDSDIYSWQIIIEGPPGTLFEGGLFPASLIFPKSYPNSPPVMTFTTPNFWHPNVYPDGKVCISILHEAKEDAHNQQEQMSEKWRPILGVYFMDAVESILVSVVSMLSDPNYESPANIDASVQMKKDYDGYKKRIRRLHIVKVLLEKGADIDILNNQGENVETMNQRHIIESSTIHNGSWDVDTDLPEIKALLAHCKNERLESALGDFIRLKCTGPA